MLAGVERPPLHPVHLVGDAHDLRRSRVTVFFRLLLALPHLVWLALWTVAVIVVAILNWFVTLFTGTPPRAFHRFLAPVRPLRPARLRVRLPRGESVPGLHGRSRHATRSTSCCPSARGRTAGRPASGSSSPSRPRSSTARSARRSSSPAILTWFVALVRGSAPWGLRNLSAYALRYSAQLNAYCPPADRRVSAREPARGRGAGGARLRRTCMTPRRAGAQRSARRARRRVGGSRLSALAVEGAVVAAPAAPRSARVLHSGAAARRGKLLSRQRSDLLGDDARPDRCARRLRALGRPVGARVGGRAGRHRDAARDARLRARLGRASCRSACSSSGGSGATTCRASATRRYLFGDWFALGGEFVFLCFALAIVMGLARKLGERWWIAAAPAFVGLALLFAFISPYLTPTHRLHDPALRARRDAARGEGARRPRPDRRRGRARRHVAAERRGDGHRAEPARRALGHARRRPLHAPRAHDRDRARARPSRAQPHLEGRRLVRALRVPGHVPDRAADAAARRHGRGRGGAAVAPRARRARVARAAARRTRSHVTARRRPTGWRCRRRATRPPRPRSSAASCRRRSTSRTRSTFEYLLLENHPTIMQRIAMAQAWRAYSNGR